MVYAEYSPFLGRRARLKIFQKSTKKSWNGLEFRESSNHSPVNDTERLLSIASDSLASTIYQMFVGSDNSSANFFQLKRIHGLMPYFVMKGILKISNPIAMIRAFLDLFLARPFGQSSLLQRIFTSGLNEEVKEIKEDMRLVAEKINDPLLIQKVDNYILAPREVQAFYKAEAGE